MQVKFWRAGSGVLIRSTVNGDIEIDRKKCYAVWIQLNRRMSNKEFRIMKYRKLFMDRSAFDIPCSIIDIPS